MQKKCRRWGIILWTDNLVHLQALDYIKRNYKDYIYILHNKDIKEDGSLKKPHYHVILYFPNQKTLSSLKKQLVLNDTDFYDIKSMSGQLRYLIHFDDEDKAQYSIDDVHGSRFMIEKFNQSVKNYCSETEQSSVIVDYIFSDNVTSLYQVFQFVLDNDIYATYRRNYCMYKDLLKEKLLNMGFKERSSKNNEL